MRLEKNREQILEFALPFAFTIITSILLIVTDFDLTFSGFFYNTSTKSWFLGDHPSVVLIYLYGPVIPAVIFFVFLVLLCCSYVLPRFFYWRAKSYFIIACILIVPLFLTHVVIKEVWKRPRPRETIQFSGNHEFKKILEIADHDFQGRSFPSGHSTAGFILTALYFLLKRKYRFWGNVSLIISLALGIWLSYARIAAGGHYLSDTVWSFTLCWFTSYFLYYKWYLAYNERLLAGKKFIFRKKRVFILVSLVFALIAMGITCIAIIKPYEENLDDIPISIPSSISNLKIKVRVEKGNIHLIKEERANILVNTWATGAGPEEIRVTQKLYVTQNNKSMMVELTVSPSSWFWSYQSHTQIFVPNNIPVQWDVNTKLGEIFRN